MITTIVDESPKNVKELSDIEGLSQSSIVMMWDKRLSEARILMPYRRQCREDSMESPYIGFVQMSKIKTGTHAICEVSNPKSLPGWRSAMQVALDRENDLAICDTISDMFSWESEMQNKYGIKI